MSYALVQIEPLQVLESYPSDLPPEKVLWPSGAATHGATAGFEREGCRLVRVTYTPDTPGEFFELSSETPSLDGATLTFTRVWAIRDDLVTVQARLIARIDSDAEAARAKYITPGSGQAMTYQEKAVQALACSTDRAPTPDKYPLLAATIDVEGATVSDVAALVLKTRAAWLQAGAGIETQRLKGKAAVSAAQDSASALAAYRALVWP